MAHQNAFGLDAEGRARLAAEMRHCLSNGYVEFPGQSDLDLFKDGRLVEHFRFGIAEDTLRLTPVAAGTNVCTFITSVRYWCTHDEYRVHLLAFVNLLGLGGIAPTRAAPAPIVADSAEVHAAAPAAVVPVVGAPVAGVKRFSHTARKSSQYRPAPVLDSSRRGRDGSDPDSTDMEMDVDAPSTPPADGVASADEFVDVVGFPSTPSPSGSGLSSASAAAPALEAVSGGFKCPYCPKVSVKYANMLQHLPHCKAGPPVPKLKCHLCGKKFTGGGALRNHLNGAGSRKPTCLYRQGTGIQTVASKK